MLSEILGLTAILPALGLMWVGRQTNLSLLSRRWDPRAGLSMLREDDDGLDEEEEEEDEEELEEDEDLEEEEWLEDEDEEDEEDEEEGDEE